MKLVKAVKLGIEAIDSECKRLAVKANLYECYRMESGRNAWNRKQRLREARGLVVEIINKNTSLNFPNGEIILSKSSEKQTFSQENRRICNNGRIR